MSNGAKHSCPRAQRYRHSSMAAKGMAYLRQGDKHQDGSQRLQPIDLVDSAAIKLEVGESSK